MKSHSVEPIISKFLFYKLNERRMVNIQNLFYIRQESPYVILLRMDFNFIRKRLSVYLFFAFSLLISCKEKSSDPELHRVKITEDTNLVQSKPNTSDLSNQNGEWQEITFENAGIQLDIRYATTNNFTKNKIYGCGKCFLRPEIAKKLIQLNRYIKQKHQLHLKVFDCYRPRPAQQKLWDIVPNPIYVTPPEKGSMHNRGMAVDLTLVDQEGKELDMGTEYDYFGREAHTDFFGHSAIVQANRALLTDLMKSIGFNTIQSEWWHFSMRNSMHPLSDWEWPCE